MLHPGTTTVEDVPMGPVVEAIDPVTTDGADAFSQLLESMKLVVEEQRRTNKLLEHVISAVNRRSLWDD